MKSMLLLLFALQCVRALAQDTAGLIVHKDARIDLLMLKATAINEFNTREARRYVQGYRILVINTNDRNKANEAKLLIYRNFPELNAYITYQSPYFKLKVGNFKTAKEAEEVLPRLTTFFPTGIYVIRDVIEINPDKSGAIEKQ